METTPINVDELALLQTNLSTKLMTLEALNTEIVELTPEAQLEEGIGRADEYSERIQWMLLQIRKGLIPSPPTSKPHDPPPRGPSPHPPRSPDPTLHLLPDPGLSTAGGGAVASGKVKLPKIALPHFKGNPIYWIAF